jgi:LysR family transcriptional regulator for bpeEF and oprC
VSARRELFTGVVPFVVTAESQSFRRAAQRLGLTPSGVSKAITRLEAELGARLMNRTSRSITLTEEGQLFLRACRQAMEQVTVARERLHEQQSSPRGTLVVSLPLILGRRVILPALRGLLARHPLLSIRVNLTDRFVQLADENVDVAVRIGAKSDSRLTRRKLSRVRWQTVAAPSYLARHGVPAHPKDLGGHECLRFVLPDGRLEPWHFRGVDDDHGAAWNGSLCSDNGDALIDAAVAGQGVFQAHDYAVADAIHRGELVALLPEFAALGPEVDLLLAPGKRSSPKVRAFVELVTQLLGASNVRSASG